MTADLTRRPELLILATDDPTQSNRLAARMVDLGVFFPFERPYVLPGALPADLSGLKMILIPSEKAAPARDRLDAFVARGGHVNFMGPDDWQSESHIERVVAQGGFTLDHPGMAAQMEALSDRDVFDVALGVCMTYLRPEWHDVLRYHIECLVEAHDVTGDGAILDQAGRLVQLALDHRPPLPATCDHISCIYAILGYMERAERPELADVCRETVDVYLERAPRFRGVLSNYLRPDVGGVLRAEIAFQACPALARLARLTNEGRYADVAVEQILLQDKELRDEATGLWRLGRGQGGRTPVLWGRGCAFSLRGIVDTLAELDAAHPGRAGLVKLLRRKADAMLNFQDANGDWHQIVDEPGSRFECSTTSWTVAGLAKAQRLGLLEGDVDEAIAKGWRASKRRTWNGFATRICGGVTASMDPEYYRSRHFMQCSYGHFHLIAAIEMLRRAAV